MTRNASINAMVKLLAFVPLLAVFSTRAFAVSLGDELILSALGDPVEVEIDVLQWEDIDLDRVQVSAAMREEYDVFKLTWLPVLDNLNFNVVGPDLNGRVRVLVSSRDPLDEPFLELLLVLRWPGGSLRREYVLLFDPPGTPARQVTTVVEEPASPAQMPVVEEPAPVPAAEPVVAAPIPTQVEEPVVEAPPVEVAVALVDEPAPSAALPAETTPPTTETPRVVVVTQQPAVIAPEPETVTPLPEPESEPPAPVVTVVVEEEPVAAAIEDPEPEAEAPDARTTIAIEVETVAPQPAQALPDTDRRVYQVRSGDSLWNIARQFRPAGAGENLYQVLLSIHDLNRASFINGNISLLKANAVLQVPTVADIEKIDAGSAEAEFDSRWDQGTQRFEAAQRGEAIPLFADRAPVEDAVMGVEDELPPGTEAPVVAEDEDALISASETNVLQPLEIASETAATDAPAVDASSPVPSITRIPDAPAAMAPPASAPALVTQTQTISVTVDTSGNTPASEAPRVTTRALVTAELETQLAAMRARRESAEAVAQQLQDSLAKARADRAAEASIFATENMLLAGSAVVLFGVLMGGIVMSLRIAGDLRLMRTSFGNTALDIAATRDWPSAVATAGAMERKEPHMPEMEVVELPLPESGNKAAPASPASPPIKNVDDLFARMDDIIGADNSPKNS